MTVRAKFQVQKVASVSWSPTVKEITMQAVSADDVEENRRFHKYTPMGSLTITVDNPPASDQLTIGKYFYVDFTEVPS
jgi:hypothetical protein